MEEALVGVKVMQTRCWPKTYILPGPYWDSLVAAANSDCTGSYANADSCELMPKRDIYHLVTRHEAVRILARITVSIIKSSGLRPADRSSWMPDCFPRMN